MRNLETIFSQLRNTICETDLTPEQKETLYQGDSVLFKIIRDGKNIEISVPVNKNEPIGY